MAQKETITTRVTRLERAMETLVEVSIKTEKRLLELREEGAEREKRLDERIEKLVIAIGELISRMPNGRKGLKP